jgi:phage shock protein C
MEPKRFYRSRTDRKVGGVAAGLGEYFLMDPMLVRLLFVVLTFAGGGGVLIYLILWIVTPEKPVEFTNSTGQAPVNPSQQEYTSPDTAAAPTQPFNAGTSPAKQRQKGSLIGGLVLITLGILFLADEFFPNFDFGDLWPVIIIVIGVGLLINAFTGKKQ